MARPRRPASSDAAPAIDALFTSPPLNDRDLARRLVGLDPPSARRRLATVLRDPALSALDAGLAAAALRLLGPGAEADSLLQLVLDRDAPPATRSAVLGLLVEKAPKVMERGIAQLDPEAAIELTTLPMQDLLAEIKSDPDRAQHVTDALLSVPADERRQMLAAFGIARRRVGLRALDAYRHALAHPEIAADARLLEPMLLGLLEDADPDTGAFLERLRDTAAEPARRSFQAALLKLGTARAEGRAPASTAGATTAWVGTPDGQGALVVVVDAVNPDGTHTVMDLCVRLTEDVRDGFVIPRATAQEIDELLGQLQEGTSCVFVQAPLGELAPLVQQAVARTRDLGRKVPRDAVPGVEFCARQAASAPVALPAPAPSPTPRDVARILARPEFRYWFFDVPDLVEHRVDPPPGGTRGLAAWRTRALTALGRGALGPRLTAMAELMARWSRWKGDAAEAALWAALAAGLRRDFAASPLAQAMLKGPGDLLARGPDAPPATERARARQALKTAHFQGVTDPRGRDVRRLDFADAIRARFGSVVGALDARDRPREHELDALAVGLADILGDEITARRRTAAAKLTARLHAIVHGVAEVRPEAAELLVGVAAEALREFVSGVCTRCPVGCLGRPTAKMAEVFFAEAHPSGLDPALA